MSPLRRHFLFTAILATCGSLAGLASAQVEHCPPCCEHDFQWFEPVALDLDCEPCVPDCGLFFHYDKLFWSISGERTALGSPNVTQNFISPLLLMQTGVGTAIVIDPDGEITEIPNEGELVRIPVGVLGPSLRDAGPRAEFGWGDRYEFGFGDREGGWMMGVLDGADQTQSFTFGGFTSIDETVAGISALNPNTTGLQGQYPNAPFNEQINPLGCVFIPFEDPQGLMFGFLDLLDQTLFADRGTLLGGDATNGALGGDGIADDLDHDFQYGPDGFSIDDTAGPEAIATLPPDFDDLYHLPVTAQIVNIRSNTQMDGVEIQRFHNLRNDHHMAKHQNNSLRLMYGVRYVRMRDKYDVDKIGGVLGDGFWYTQIDNNLVGPQLGLSWYHQKQKFLFELNTRAMAGFNIGDWQQTGSLGGGTLGGTVYNQPLNFNPVHFNNGQQTEGFSPLAELRAQLTYRFTSAISARLGYTATYIGNVHRASSSIRYRLPDMGFKEGSAENVFVNGVNFGVDVVY